MEEAVTCIDKVRQYVAIRTHANKIDSLKFVNELIRNTGYGFTINNLAVLCKYGLGNLTCNFMDIIIKRRADLGRELNKDEIEYIVNSVIDSASPEDKNKFNELEECARKTIEIL